MDLVFECPNCGNTISVPEKATITTGCGRCGAHLNWHPDKGLILPLEEDVPDKTGQDQENNHT